MIVDKARVTFLSGSGGQGSSGLVKLSSGKSVGLGGDGGRGGSVILKVNPHLYDLKTFKGNKKFAASSGEAGSKKNKKGKDADDLIVGVPSGTRVVEQGKIIVDLLKEEEQFLICQGGAGGLGNFKRDYTVAAKEGRIREVTLDYRIPNQAAILGFANSGKTTLFNALSGQNQKVADYPFTTTSCLWAPVEYESRRFVVLDTPPLTRITKPSQKGRNDFLGQLLRSEIVLILSDNPTDYRRDFKDILAEVNGYNSELLAGKKFFYLLAKVDTIDKKAEISEVLPIAAKQGLNIEELKKRIVKILR